jgi:hypothetical protein
MLSHFEVSTMMDAAIKRGFPFMKETGFLYPFFYLLKKGSAIDTEAYSNETLLNFQSSDSVSSQQVYGAIAAFKDAPISGPNNFNDRAKELVRITQPDAIGCVLVVLCKQMDPKLYKKLSKTYQASNDPEAAKALHACYYIKGDRVAGEKLLPILDRGPKKITSSHTEPEINQFDNDEEESVHDITIIDSGWIVENESVPAYIQYPY